MGIVKFEINHRYRLIYILSHIQVKNNKMLSTQEVVSLILNSKVLLIFQRKKMCRTQVLQSLRIASLNEIKSSHRDREKN